MTNFPYNCLPTHLVHRSTTSDMAVQSKSRPIRISIDDAVHNSFGRFWAGESIHFSPPITVKCSSQGEYPHCIYTSRRLGSKYLLFTSSEERQHHQSLYNPAFNVIASNRYHFLTTSPQSTLPTIPPLSIPQSSPLA